MGGEFCYNRGYKLAGELGLGRILSDVWRRLEKKDTIINQREWHR